VGHEETHERTDPGVVRLGQLDLAPTPDGSVRHRGNKHADALSVVRGEHVPRDQIGAETTPSIGTQQGGADRGE